MNNVTSLKRDTFVYSKLESGEPIHLDAYSPPDVDNAPVLLWFHGGGLLQGHRERNMGPHMLRAALDHSFILISADYPLAPQVSVPTIVNSVLECIAFIRAGRIPNSDPKRLAVSGSSAGGYLAFLAGLFAEPKPQVILPIYPITDPLGEFFTTQWPISEENLSRENIEALSPFIDASAKIVTNNEKDSPRGKMYSWMLTQGNLASLLGVKGLGDEYRVARRIKERGLPPTFVVHPDEDIHVGVQQSDEVVGVMVGLGLNVGYLRVEGKGHGFDEDENVELPEMYAFMKEYL